MAHGTEIERPVSPLIDLRLVMASIDFHRVWFLVDQVPKLGGGESARHEASLVAHRAAVLATQSFGCGRILQSHDPQNRQMATGP